MPLMTNSNSKGKILSSHGKPNTSAAKKRLYSNCMIEETFFPEQRNLLWKETTLLTLKLLLLSRGAHVLLFLSLRNFYPK